MTFLSSSLRVSALAAAACAFLVSPAAKADTINVVNGDFSQVSGATSSSQFGQYYSKVQLTGWSSTGYSFVFMPQAGTTSGTQADNTGAVAQSGGLKLWGPGTGSNNGLTNSPNGGNFLGLDGTYEAPTTISQRVSGLTPGSAATVSFFYAGAQQSGYSGVTTEWFDVSLGDQTISTPVLNDANHGFTGWQSASFTFMPTSASETLTFLAHGTPNGEPPFTLLDGVTVSSSVTPEPSSLALFGSGVLALGGVARRRFTRR